MSDKAGELRKRLFRLIKSSLILIFVLTLLSFLRPQLVSMVSDIYPGSTGTSDLALNVISLLFVIYFGYFILIDVKYLLDLVTAKFRRPDQGKLQTIAYDIAGIISLVLASSLLSPILSSIKDVGGTAVSVLNLALLAIGLILIYHMANQVYTLLKQRIEKIVQETKQSRSDQLRSEHQASGKQE